MQWVSMYQSPDADSELRSTGFGMWHLAETCRRRIAILPKCHVEVRGPRTELPVRLRPVRTELHGSEEIQGPTPGQGSSFRRCFSASNNASMTSLADPPSRINCRKAMAASTPRKTSTRLYAPVFCCARLWGALMPSGCPCRERGCRSLAWRCRCWTTALVDECRVFYIGTLSCHALDAV